MSRPGFPLPRPRPGPFSRPLAVDTVPDDGLDLAIEATADECCGIAADVGLLAIDALSARFRIDHRAGGGVVVTGVLSAGITQACVVSLEPFHTAVAQDIALTFAPAADSTERLDRHRHRRRDDDRRAAAVMTEPAAGDDARDAPDPIIAGKIDLGSAAVEFLVLSLDPYPRKPGVQFTDVSIGEGDDPEPSPFAALGRLKDRP